MSSHAATSHRRSRRLGLDACRLVVTLDLALEADRQKLAQIYRFGRVAEQAEFEGRARIEADVPRRLWERLQQGGRDAEA